MTAPSPISDRILALDALRGIAVIGIVAMNVLAFAMPGPAYYNPLAYSPSHAGGVGPADYWVWLGSFVFIEDKFPALFAMLFGAGCLILIERERPQPRNAPWRPHYARMAVLFAVGLAHAVLFADNDVLRAYALAGLALPLLAGLSSQGLFSVALGLLCMHLALSMTSLGPPLVAFHMKHSGSDALLWAERQFGHDAAAIAVLLEQGREGLGERAVRQMLGIAGQIRGLIAGLPLNLSAIALGMGLWRSGMLKGEWRIFRLQRIAGLSVLAALPGLLLLSAWLVSEGFPAALVGPVALAFSAPFDMLLALSYAALAMAFLRKDNGFALRLAEAGRLSLSNYIATSLILASIFASWGLGLFGEVTRWQAASLGVVPVAGMLLWSPLWVARFGQGPLERLWHAAARALY